jgi:hypothetical protein
MSKAKTHIRLWVCNQDEAGCDSRRGWAVPDGVGLCDDEMDGERQAVWDAFRSLRQAVMAAGHGDPAIDAEASPPSLVGCPMSIHEDGSSSSISVARNASVDHDESPVCPW